MCCHDGMKNISLFSLCLISSLSLFSLRSLELQAFLREEKSEGKVSVNERKRLEWFDKMIALSSL